MGDPPPESTRESERETVRMDAMANLFLPSLLADRRIPPFCVEDVVPSDRSHVGRKDRKHRSDVEGRRARADRPFPNDETRTNERFLEACDGWRTGAASLEAQDPTWHPRTCRARRFMDQARASRHPSSFRTS